MTRMAHTQASANPRMEHTGTPAQLYGSSQRMSMGRWVGDDCHLILQNEQEPGPTYKKPSMGNEGAFDYP